MITVSRRSLIVITIAGGAALLAGGAALGSAVAFGGRPTEEVGTVAAAACNLRVTWDRVSQEHLAVYEDSTWVSETGRYGRTANISCTDDEILRWQQQRRENGLDAAVCRPVLHGDVDGLVYSIGCAVPTWVARDEPR